MTTYIVYGANCDTAGFYGDRLKSLFYKTLTLLDTSSESS